MKKFLLASVLLAVSSFLVSPLFSGFRTDNLTATGTITIPNSATPPSTDCDEASEAGRLYFDTDATSGRRIFGCQGASGWVLQGDGNTGGGGGGSSALAVTTGTVSNISVITSSPTAIINFSTSTFSVQLTGDATAFVKLSGDHGDLTYTGSGVANLDASVVTAAEIATDGVSADELNATGVEAELEAVLDLDQLQGQIGDAQIADSAVDGGTGGEIADGSITADDLGANSVGASEVAANSVGTTDIINSTITVNDMGADSVGGTQIIASTITASDLGTDSVSADELNATGVEAELEAVLDLDQLQGQIGDAQVADGAVDGGTGGEVTDDSLTSADIGADAVGQSELIESMNFVPTGAWDFGGATSLEIPQNATPTLDAVGEMALDTTVAAHYPSIAFATATASGEMYVIAVSSDDYHDKVDGDLVTYDSTTGGMILDQTLNILVPISAASFAGTVTNGFAGGVRTGETSTNKVNYDFIALSSSTTNYFQCSYSLPTGWDESTVTYYVVWTATAGTGGVGFNLQGLCRSDDDALDTAYGTAINVDDTLIATGDVHVSAQSSALTLGGTCAENDYIVWRGYRDVADAGDTLTAQAQLLELRIKFTRNVFSD